MDLTEFTHLTLAVLEDQGVAGYAPTIVAGDAVQIIQGIPSDIDPREALQETVLRLGLQQSEFYFGVRSGPGEVTTGFHTRAETRFQCISQLHQGFIVSELSDCPWWTLDGGREQ